MFLLAAMVAILLMFVDSCCETPRKESRREEGATSRRLEAEARGLEDLADGDVRRHHARDALELELSDEFHAQRRLHRRELELRGDGLEPVEDRLGGLLDQRGPLLRVLRGRSGRTLDRCDRSDRHDELSVDRHLGDVGRSALVHQRIDDRLDVPVVFQPDSELHRALAADPSSDEQRLEVDAVRAGGAVQVARGERPGARRGPAVRGGVAVDRRPAQELLVLAQEADDQRVDARRLGPLAPGLERVGQLVHFAAVGERVAHRLRVRALVGQVARGDDRLNAQARAVERVALEELQKRVLKLWLRLVDLVDQEHHGPFDPPLDGEEPGPGVVNRLVVGDDGEAQQVGRLQDGEVHVVDREPLSFRSLHRHFGLSGPGLAEDHEVPARADVELQCG